MTTPGKTASHGAVLMYELPASDSMLPKVAMLGGTDSEEAERRLDDDCKAQVKCSQDNDRKGHERIHQPLYEQVKCSTPVGTDDTKQGAHQFLNRRQRWALYMRYLGVVNITWIEDVTLSESAQVSCIAWM